MTVSTCMQFIPKALLLLSGGVATPTLRYGQLGQ